MEPSACRGSPGDLWGWVESQAKVITSDGLEREQLWITGPSEPNKCVRETSTEKEKREREWEIRPRDERRTPSKPECRKPFGNPLSFQWSGNAVDSQDVRRKKFSNAVRAVKVIFVRRMTISSVKMDHLSLRSRGDYTSNLKH